MALIEKNRRIRLSAVNHKHVIIPKNIVCCPKQKHSQIKLKQSLKKCLNIQMLFHHATNTGHKASENYLFGKC